MQMIIDFFLSGIFSIILIFIYFLLLKKWPCLKFVGLYIYNIITFGLVRWINKDFLLEWFGCGCVPIAQTNKLNIALNTNDITFYYYFLTLVILIILAFKNAKKLKTFKRIFYICSVVIINLILSYIFIKIMMWQ